MIRHLTGRARPGEGALRPVADALCGGYGKSMWTIILILLAIWIILSILGFLIEGLVWLAIVGIGLIVITLLIGAVRQALSKRN